jgi:NAD(P)-dependent dehydrogenase (short-subunit alcohol dehydrogenase family)
VRIEGAGALIAGGASGLGAATARRLHPGGANAVIVDVERGEALAAELGGARFLRTDVGEPGELEAAVAAGEGGLRVAVSCAGVGAAECVAGRRGRHGLETFEPVIAINVRAARAAGVARPCRLGSPDEYAALVVHCVENPMLNRESIRLDGAPRMPPGGVAA